MCDWQAQLVKNSIFGKESFWPQLKLFSSSHYCSPNINCSDKKIDFEVCGCCFSGPHLYIFDHVVNTASFVICSGAGTCAHMWETMHGNEYVVYFCWILYILLSAHYYHPFHFNVTFYTSVIHLAPIGNTKFLMPPCFAYFTLHGFCSFFF